MSSFARARLRLPGDGLRGLRRFSCSFPPYCAVVSEACPLALLLTRVALFGSRRIRRRCRFGVVYPSESLWVPSIGHVSVLVLSGVEMGTVLVASVINGAFAAHTAPVDLRGDGPAIIRAKRYSNRFDGAFGCVDGTVLVRSIGIVRLGVFDSPR